MAKWLRNPKSIFKFGLLAFFLLLMWTGRTYPEESRSYPELLFGVTVIFIIVSFIQDYIKSIKSKGEKKREEVKKPEPPPSDIREEKSRWIKEIEEKSEGEAGYELLEKGLRKKRLWQSILIILVSLVIGYLGGFLLTVPFYFVGFGILHGQRKQTLKYIIIALGFTLVVYLFFTSLMGVPLLRGIFWD